MTADPRAALAIFISALERHLEASSARRGENDPAVVAAYQDVAEAFDRYEEALMDAYEEVTPLEIFSDDEDDFDDDVDDEGDEDIDEADEDIDEDEDLDDDEDDEDDLGAVEDLDEDFESTRVSRYVGLDDEDFDDDSDDEDEFAGDDAKR